MALTQIQVGQIVQFRISETQYRPFLVVKVTEVQADGQITILVSGYIFLDLWNDDKTTMGLGMSAGEFRRYVTTAQEGDEIGQWRRIS